MGVKRRSFLSLNNNNKKQKGNDRSGTKSSGRSADMLHQT